MRDDNPLTLEHIYPLPRALDTLEEHERFYHRDLSHRARAELARERERLRIRLLLEDDPDPWLLQRMKKLTELLDRAR
jgi:hypothetical protein